jgi:hypothetical protein
MKWAAATWVLIFAPVVVLSQPRGEWTYQVTFHGKPVAGAKVRFEVYRRSLTGLEPTGQIAFDTTDENGQARFPAPSGTDPNESVRCLARDAKNRCGFGSIFTGTRYPPTIELCDTVELTGRVTGADGKAIPNLTLKPAALGPENFARFGNRLIVFAETPDWFWEAFPVQIAADGTFTIKGAPAGYSVAVRFESPDVGSGRIWVIPGKPATYALEKAGAIKFRFDAPPDVKPGKQCVTVTRVATGNFVEATQTATSKSDSELTIANLVPGEYQIGFGYDGPAQHFPKSAGKVLVKPEAMADVAATLEPAARIQARFIDSKTGKGVAGASLTASFNRATASTVAGVVRAVADGDGRIDLLVPAGLIQVAPQAANGYAVVKFSNDQFNQYSTQLVPIKPGQTHDFGTFALAKLIEFRGIVVDDSGKPVSGVTVSSGYSDTQFSVKPAVSNADGRFVLKGVNPEGGLFGVTAKKGNAITVAPVPVSPAKPDAEVRLVISEKFASKICVRVVDRAGKPIPGVSVSVMHSVMYLSRSGGIVGAGGQQVLGTTPDDGRFESAALQAGDRYSLMLNAPGFKSLTAPEWIAVAGETHDYSNIVLSRTEASVSGRVTDPKGEPIAGATVFDNAGGPRNTSTTTDAKGNFTLKGLFEGTTILCVQAKGFRFATVPATTDGQQVAVNLRRLADPPAPPPVVPDSHRQAIEKLARHLLESMWKKRDEAKDDGKIVVRAMAGLDRATALKWRDEEKARSGGGNDLTSEIEAADRDRKLFAAAKEDPDEAIELLKPVTGMEGFRAVCALASDLLPDHPEKAMPIAEEAVVRARGLAPDYRRSALAQTGELVYHCGKNDAGRKLIEEAAVLVAPLGNSGMDGYYRGFVASRIALYDPARARTMIDALEEANDYSRWLAQACIRVAESDLGLAKKWMTEFRPSQIIAKPVAQQKIAYHLAATNPDEAISFAHQIEDLNTRATTMAGVAIRLKDRQRAIQLIDDTIDRILADSTGYYRRNYQGGGVVGLILYRAKQLGHPDLAGLRDKIVTVRTSPDSYSPEHGKGDVEMAMYLALTDPETARTILSRGMAAGAQVENNWDLPFALAVADPAGATSEMDAEVTRTVRAQHGYVNTRLERLARLLSQPDRLAENIIRKSLFEYREE